MNKYHDTCRILAEGITQSNNTKKTGINNNDLIIGPSGAGKTRGYVIPNILQANESMIVADTKGDLAKAFAPYLKKKGYRVFVLDFKNTSKSCGYNPFDNIRRLPGTLKYNEQDMIRLVRCIAPDLTRDDRFWDERARTLLTALVAYVLENADDEGRNLVTVQKLFSIWSQETAKKMFSELERKNPGSFSLHKYNMIKNVFQADRTNACIEAFVGAALDIFEIEGVKMMLTNPEKIDIRSVGCCKTALFLNISDTDRSMDKLVNVFYTQALQMLCDEAEKHEGCRLPVPGRIIMDDFATNACVEDFDKIISVIRSRDIYVSIVIQSITQLDGLYGQERARTIINNCDTMLYLGGQDINTAELVSVKANMPINSILDMGIGESYLFVRGGAPRKVRKYNPAAHPEYRCVKDVFGEDESEPELKEEYEEKPFTIGFSCEA